MSIEVIRTVRTVDLEFFRSVADIQVTQSGQQGEGDLVDALLVGMDLLLQHCAKKKYKKRLFLITDGESRANCDDKEMETIVNTILENDIKLNCITMDFCNELAEDDDDEEGSGDEEGEDSDSEGKQGKKLRKEETEL